MKLILQAPTDTALVNGATLTGPLEATVDQAEVASVVYDRGVVVVSGGVATEVAAMTEVGLWSMFACLIVGLAAGIHFAKQWVGRFGLVLFFAAPAFADFTKYTHTETVVNPTPDLQKKRVSVYPREASGGETFYQAQGLSYNRYVFLLNTAKMRLAMKIGTSYSWVTDGITITRVPPSYEMTGTTPAVDLPTSYTPGGAGGNALRWMFKDTTYSDFPSTIDATYWNTTANHLNNGVTTSTPTTTEETAAATYTRGTLAQQWQIEIAGHAAATVFVERDYPFYLVIENLQAYLNENGDYSEEWEEEDELTSTESTVITPPEEQTRTQLETPAFSAGPDPDPVTRPTDVSTNEGMDQAAEARHTESQRYLKSIKEATEAGVNQTASAAGTAHNDAISIRSAAEAAGTAAADAAEGAGNQVTGAINTAAGTAHADAEGIKDALTELGGEPGGDDGMGDDDPGGFNDANAAAAAATSGLQAALSGLADEVAAFTAIFSTSITGASFPVVTLPIPGMLGGGTLVFDFGDYSDWWNLLRGILLIVAGWGFASAILENIRQAVS